MNVFISSSSRVEDKDNLFLARRVAELIASISHTLICGGNSSGMMKEVYQVFKDKHCPCYCYTLPIYQEKFAEDDNVFYVENTFDRAKKIYHHMDMAIFLPGGTGSLNEIFALLEEVRTTTFKPIILYNETGHFDLFLQQLERLIQDGFNDRKVLEMIEVVESIDELKEKQEKGGF